MKLALPTMVLTAIALGAAPPAKPRPRPLRDPGVAHRGVSDTGLMHPALPAIGSHAPPLAPNHWVNTPPWVDSARSRPLTFGDGHVYVLDFTAMWCGSCVGLYPAMNEAFKQYESQGLRVVFVSGLYTVAEDHMTEFTSAAQEIAAWPKYLAKHGITHPLAIYDSVKALKRIHGDSASRLFLALPKVVVVDGAGVVREVLTGWNNEATRRQLFSTLATVLPPKKP